MEATVRKSTKPAMRRKVIDIKPDTFRGLSVIAASRGTNLKRFIERSLDELVESYDDATIYRYLQQYMIWKAQGSMWQLTEDLGLIRWYF